VEQNSFSMQISEICELAKVKFLQQDDFFKEKLLRLPSACVIVGDAGFEIFCISRLFFY